MKARDDWNYYKNVLNSGIVIRQVVDSAIGVLREIIRTTFVEDGLAGKREILLAPIFQRLNGFFSLTPWLQPVTNAAKSSSTVSTVCSC